LFQSEHLKIGLEKSAEQFKAIPSIGP